MIYGLEKAPTTGTEHLHLYVRLNSRLYKATLKSLFPRACVEIARGDELQCYNYCSKNGEYKEYGQRLNKVNDYIGKTERFKIMIKDLMNKEWNEFEALYPYESFHQKKKT